MEIRKNNKSTISTEIDMIKPVVFTPNDQLNRIMLIAQKDAELVVIGTRDCNNPSRANGIANVPFIHIDQVIEFLQEAKKLQQP